MAISRKQSEAAIRVNAGFRHPSLGDIGGWDAVVIRSFGREGVTYLDVELEAGTIMGLSRDQRNRFYQGKLVFTRLRASQSDTSPIDSKEDPSQRLKTIEGIQREWYGEVGVHEHDPTQYVADRAYDDDVDLGRRDAVFTMAKAAAIIIFVGAVMYRDCEEDKQDDRNHVHSYGSWGRSGGGYYG